MIIDEILAKAKLLKDARETITFETTWGRVKCQDGEYVYFPRYFGEGIASKIDKRKTFVTLTFESPANETAFLVAALEHLCERVERAEEGLRQIASAASDEDFFVSQTADFVLTDARESEAQFEKQWGKK